MHKDLIQEELVRVLGDYCMRVCHAKCCKGQLELGLEELLFVTDGDPSPWEGTDALRQHEGNVVISVERIPCVHLTYEGGRTYCDAHSDGARPSCCAWYPFLPSIGRHLSLDGACPGVRQGLLDSMLPALCAFGYEVDVRPVTGISRPSRLR